ncbi:MAG: L-aspartate oxidase, partial [Asticcacaulis sp. 32-58-5]
GAFLDATVAVGEHFPAEFPTVFASCQSAGIDPRIEPMPVAPAAHYHMGGISTDIHGRSSLKGLYAVGECASTGVHGANRLASNSLLEAAAFGERVGLECAQTLSNAPFTPDTAAAIIPALPPTLPPENLQNLRDAVSRYAGVVRDETGLKTLLNQIESLETDYAGSLALTNARVIALSALRRRESRGSHYRSDYPQPGETPERTFTTWSQCSATILEPQMETL